MSVFLSFAPAWLSTLFYVYWLVLMVMLVTDDREPSITLAWLFVLLFLPFVGVTGIPDKRVALWAAQTYYRKLLEAGARIYLYTAGFLHAKTIVVDGMLSAVGTMNMDQRSLKLHKEMMVWVFDKGFARRVADAFEADMRHCHEVAIRTCWRSAA